MNSVVLGQSTQKKIPKPRALPTTQTKQDSTALEPQKERLELPEVLIVGKNLSIKKPGSKHLFGGLSNIKIGQMKILKYETDPSSYTSPAQTPQFEPTKINHATGAEVRFGTYNSAYIKANHWQQFKKVKIDFDGKYERSEGQYQNSQFEYWNVAFGLEYQFSPKHSLFGAGKYKTNKYGLWAFEKHQRKWDQFILDFGLRGKFSPRFGYTVTVQQNRTPIQKDIEIESPFPNLRINREQNRLINGILQYRSNEWGFQLNGKYLSNKSQKYENGKLFVEQIGELIPSNDNSYSSIKLGATKYLGQKGSVAIGANYQYYKLDVLESKKSKVNPWAEVNLNITPKFRLFTIYEPRLRYITQSELLVFNPFYFTDSDHFPVEDYKHAIDIGIEWRLMPGLSSQVTYQYRSIENLLYWENLINPFVANLTPTNLFKLNSLAKGHFSLLKIDLSIGNSRPFDIKSSLTFLNSGIDKIGNELQIEAVPNDIPYLEDVSWPTEFNYRFHPNWTASVIANYFGSRYYSLIFPDKSKSIWQLNGKLNYYVEGINFYLLGTNLLNQKYEIWQNYSATGSQFFIGIEAKF